MKESKLPEGSMVRTGHWCIQIFVKSLVYHCISNFYPQIIDLFSKIIHSCNVLHCNYTVGHKLIIPQ